MTLESRQYFNPSCKITDRDNKAGNRYVKMTDVRSSVFQTIYNKTLLKNKEQISPIIDHGIISKFQDESHPR